MIAPVRIQLRRTKGWRMPPNTVKVDRTTRYGNEFVMAHEGTRDLAIRMFREKAEAQMEAGPAFYAPLRGKNLACWCRLDAPCHADVLLALANALPPDGVGRRGPASTTDAGKSPGIPSNPSTSEPFNVQ